MATIQETPSSSPSPDAAFAADHPSVQPFRLPPRAFLSRHFPGPSASTASGNRPEPPSLVATGAIVFSPALPSSSTSPAHPSAPLARPATEPRILLLQRAAHDSMPLRWETPGGGCDHDDASVLAACARELAEEAGLRAVSVGPFVPLPPSLSSRGTAASVDRAPQDGEAQSESGKTTGGHFFRTRRGNLVCKFYFVVEAADGMDVVLDPNEHAAFVWATEQEVVQERTIASDGRESIGLQFTTVEQRAVLLEAFKLWRRDGSN